MWLIALAWKKYCLELRFIASTCYLVNQFEAPTPHSIFWKINVVNNFLDVLFMVHNIDWFGNIAQLLNPKVVVVVKTSIALRNLTKQCGMNITSTIDQTTKSFREVDIYSLMGEIMQLPFQNVWQNQWFQRFTRNKNHMITHPSSGLSMWPINWTVSVISSLVKNKTGWSATWHLLSVK